MKKLKRLAAVLLAGIMALALFTACSDSDPGNPEFDPEGGKRLSESAE